MTLSVQRIIEDARDAELCRNLGLFRETLVPFWEDTAQGPEVASFDPAVQAELLRLCGVFLSQFGRAKGLADYQLRAKDLLTRAADIFKALNQLDRAAETRISLANCYLFSGEISEYDDILRSVNEEFDSFPDHQVSIRVKLNRISAAMRRDDLSEALRLVGEVSGIISSEHDLRLKTQFHNLAGIAYLSAGDLERSIYHARESVRIAREAGNQMFLAMNLNDLSFVYRAAGRLDQAGKTSDEAIAVSDARGYNGWTAHFIDTKALIYLDQRKYAQALSLIERSISVFSEGEDHSGLSEAMWTKCLCLLRLDRVSEAVMFFAELKALAPQIGEASVQKFARLFAEEVYAIKHLAFADEVAAFKRGRVVKAMRDSNGHVANAARNMGLKSQQHLSDILNNQFPDIYDELSIKRRARRSDAALPKRSMRTKPGVTRLIMPKNRTYSFNFSIPADAEPQFYYFPRNMMEEFGVRKDAIVAVMSSGEEPPEGETPVLYVKDEKFRIGRISFNEQNGVVLVDLEEQISLSNVQLLGIPSGYCPASAQNKRTMKFNALRPVKSS